MARVEGAGGALGKHIDGDGKRPETAAPRVLVGADGVEEKLKPVVLLDDEGEEIDLAAAKTRTTEAQKYMQKCRRKKTRGRQPMGGSTWVFAGPPRYDSEDAWSSAEVRSWAADCTKWAKKRSGKGSRIAHCALHQDEAAPHLHVTVIVADEQGRLGWNRIRKNFGVEGKTSGVLLMSGLQDNFHAAVGSKHGLDRGEVGSNREHAPVDRALGLKIRVEEERNRTHQAKVRAGQTIAGVLEHAEDDAAKRYKERVEKAQREAKEADLAVTAARRGETAANERARTEATEANTARTARTVADERAARATTDVTAANEAAAAARTETTTARQQAATAEGRVVELAQTLRTVAAGTEQIVKDRDQFKKDRDRRVVELAQTLRTVAAGTEQIVKDRDQFKKDRDRFKGELDQVPAKVEKAVKDRDAQWRPILEEKVSEAKQGRDDELQTAVSAAGINETVMEEMRTDRDYAQTALETMQRDTKVVVAGLKEELDQVPAKVEKAVKDRDAQWRPILEEKVSEVKQWMTRVVRELRPDRRDLDGAARRAGLEDEEIKSLTEEVERGRGGMVR